MVVWRRKIIRAVFLDPVILGVIILGRHSRVDDVSLEDRDNVRPFSGEDDYEREQDRVRSVLYSAK